MKEIELALKKPHFGLHITLDGYKCNYEILNNLKAVFDFLNSAVRELGMKKLLEPRVVSAKANFKKDPGGYSGFVMIQESHISIHTFPKRRFVSIDVYSCTDFDYKLMIKFTKEFFQIKSVETNVIIRGRRYPFKDLI